MNDKNLDDAMRKVIFFFIAPVLGIVLLFKLGGWITDLVENRKINVNPKMLEGVWRTTAVEDYFYHVWESPNIFMDKLEYSKFPCLAMVIDKDSVKIVRHHREKIYDGYYRNVGFDTITVKYVLKNKNELYCENDDDPFIVRKVTPKEMVLKQEYCNEDEWGYFIYKMWKY